jgi:Na+/melibiose symporter-like transporter
MNVSRLNEIGGMRLALLAVAVLTLPLLPFADMEPRGIGVFTAYIVPSVVVILFFVLMLDALMNRVFMIEQPDDIKETRRLRMWLSFGVGVALLVIWSTYFRTLLDF